MRAPESHLTLVEWLLVIKYKYIINNVALVQAMKAYGKVEVQLHSLQNSVLEGLEWSASRPRSFILQETAHGIYSVRGQISPEASLNDLGDRKISGSGRGSKQYSSIQPVAHLHSKVKLYSHRTGNRKSCERWECRGLFYGTIPAPRGKAWG